MKASIFAKHQQNFNRKNMKKIIGYGAVLVVMHTLAASAQETAVLTLQQCVETAFKNNLDVKQRELQMQTAGVYAEQAKTNLLPVVFGDATHGINEGKSIDPYTNSYINQQVNFADYGLNGSLILFSGLNLQHSIRQNTLAFQASEMDWQQAKDNLMLNVMISYLGVLAGNDLVKSAKEQAAVSQEQVDRLNKLNEEGAIPPSQLFDLKGQLADDQLAIIEAQRVVDAAKVNLSQLMNVPYDPNLTVAPLTAEQFTTMYDATPDKIYAAAVQQLAVVKAAALRERSAEKGVQAARGNYYPTLSLNGNLNTNYSNAALRDVYQNTTEVTTSDYVQVDGNKLPVITPQDNFSSEKITYNDQVKNNVSSSVSLGLSIPILNSLQARHRVELAKIDKENATAVLQTTQIRLRQDIEQAYLNMTTSYQRYQTLTAQLDAYNESFREVGVRFNEGAVNSVDYVVAKNNADRSNSGLIVSKYEYVLRTKILDYYQGKALW